MFLSEFYSLGGGEIFLPWAKWGKAQFEAEIERKAWVRQVRSSASCWAIVIKGMILGIRWPLGWKPPQQVTS